jgi:hypothetical protein
VWEEGLLEEDLVEDEACEAQHGNAASRHLQLCGSKVAAGRQQTLETQTTCKATGCATMCLSAESAGTSTIVYLAAESAGTTMMALLLVSPTQP